MTASVLGGHVKMSPTAFSEFEKLFIFVLGIELKASYMLNALPLNYTPRPFKSF